MAVKVNELKDNAVVDIKVNKNYYLMVKASLFHLFTQLTSDNSQREEILKTIMEKKYDEMSDLQRTFYTLTLLITEIERSAKEQNLTEEKEVLLPGDPGYVEPATQG
jgi:hypothetical protein